MRLSYSYENKSTNQQLFSQKGFTLPIVALFVLAFLVAPVAFWFTSSKENSDVQGAEASNLENGVYLKIISGAGSWDLNEYLCKTKAECESSLTSGKKWESLSGGMTQGSSKRLNDSEALNGYEYVKVFVKPGWGGDTQKSFSVSVVPGKNSAQILDIDNVSVVLIPTEAIKSASLTQVVFTAQ